MKFRDFLQERDHHHSRFRLGDKVKHKHHMALRGIISGYHTYGWPVALMTGGTAFWHNDHCEPDHEHDTSPGAPPPPAGGPSPGSAPSGDMGGGGAPSGGGMGGDAGGGGGDGGGGGGGTAGGM